MPDNKQTLSPISIGLHWIVTISIISMLAFGLYLDQLDNTPRKSQLIEIHKLIGFAVFLIAVTRISWRGINGFPAPVDELKKWEIRLSRIIHWLLLISTVLMPVSGIMISLGLGYSVPVLGITEIGPLSERNKLVSDTGYLIHENLAYILMGLIVIHVSGALKHHWIDKGRTLDRMLARRS
ncbi:MAG: cytochrome b [Desulfobulbia bacterium]